MLCLFSTKHFLLEIGHMFMFGIHVPSSNPKCLMSIYFGPFLLSIWSGYDAA